MHRAILEACFPWFLWLMAAFAGLWLVARVSGASLRLARLRRLHRCQEGSVQTLSFVLTLPLFMMIVLFIVQVSQLMIGITVVHYAAFAAARAAIVWLAAETPDEPQNTMDPITVDETSVYPAWMSRVVVFNQIPTGRAWKYNKIWSAAALACLPIAPSKQYLTASALSSFNSNLGNTTAKMYRSMVPKAANDPVIARRILNKNYYACEHTWIQISGADYGMLMPGSGLVGNSLVGRTDNPLNHPIIQWKSNEIGWQDPITVQVWFRFPLLTGPGRFLSPGHFLKTQLAPPDGTPDKVSSGIQIWDKKDHPQYAESVYWTKLTATATITLEGIKSGIPMVYFPERID
jgi:hypothetical protein